MNVRLRQIFVVFLAGFVLLAGALFYWQIYRGPQLLARADNPRHHEEKVREPRGRLLDRQGRVLVESLATDGQLVRHYVYPPLVHVTGFDSVRYGNSGIEASRDADLRGLASRSSWAQTWDRLLHRQRTPSDVSLTIDLDLQKAADAALRASGRNGAIILLEAESGRILALASHPYFNPNHLDDDWPELSNDPARPFLSRATQGLYAPGSCFTVVTLAAALNAQIATLDEVFSDVPPVLNVEGTSIRNPVGSASSVTLEEAFSSAQPVVFAQLALRLGWANFRSMLDALWLDRSLPLEIQTTASPLPGRGPDDAGGPGVHGCRTGAAVGHPIAHGPGHGSDCQPRQGPCPSSWSKASPPSRVGPLCTSNPPSSPQPYRMTSLRPCRLL